MNLLHRIAGVLRHLVFRDRISRELEEEMRGHVAMRAEAIRARGAAPAEAQAEARRRFGNVTQWQETSRDAWGAGGTERFARDVVYAFRRLRLRPGFAGAVVLVLGLGIGATTAMFSAVDAAILRPLPFASPGELVVVPMVRIPFDAGDGSAPSGSNPVDVDRLLAMPQTFRQVAAYAVGAVNVPDPERPSRVTAGVVSEHFFATLGVRPASGRSFSHDESVPKGPRVVVLSDAFWRSHFGGRQVRGESITLNTEAYQIIGIMPPGFSFPSAADLWIPLTNPTTSETFRAFRGYLPSTVVARLAPGATVESASTQLMAIWTEAARKNAVPGQQNATDRALADVRVNGTVIPLQTSLTGDTREPLLILLGATALLLLIACANVTNLLLSQAATRRREVALRAVLGATRGRILRQLLTESVMLAMLGVAAGLVVAPLTLHFMQAAFPPDLAGLAAARLDLRVLAFASLVGLVTGIGFGLWPAFTITRSAPAETIKAGGGHGATSAGGGSARRVLVVAELAMTVMLLIGAGLMLRSFARLMEAGRGIDAERVGTLQMAMWLPSHAQRLARIERMLAELDRNPSIQASGVVNDLPLGGGGGIGLMVEVPGYQAPDNGDLPFARFRIASGGYFQALGIPLLQGRVFSAVDDSLAPRTAVISDRMAKTFWPGLSPLGRVFSFPGDSIPLTVIGVVADTRGDGLEHTPDPEMYLSAGSRSMANFALVARSTLPAPELLRALTDAVRAADPSQAVFGVRSMTDVVGRSVAARRTNTLLIAAFAGLALLLASVGVYAVVAYGVNQRRREFGIRAALGAAGGDLVRLVGREMIWIGTIGLGIGLAGAWALSRVLESLLFEVQRHDPVTFAAVPLALLATVIVATLVPARRTLRVNPADVIRGE